ncbi:bifunctional (p)ppGpp synthetase/guanosine-3',5'-bis(diphosphate) 3'-pyrophosphohydrolase [Candidatus Peregrinibacteria bacterium]|nr:bifunctional (p)ppGpp synthetase/guanosine-3',5'-bis(diphosphate) 3'-pyrophosphohydrolase [Candidatus Peregrinibacteria bacterium]
MQHAAEELLDAVLYLPPDEQEGVRRALEKVTEWHAGQKRESGEAFVIHPIRTALSLARLSCGSDTLIAGLLHDVVEDGAESLMTVEEEFGPEIAKLVDAVTKLTKLRYAGRRSERQIQSLRKMLLAASDDLRVIFIKLADRLHNVETIEALRPDKQQRIAHETLDIYVPFARMTGLWWMKRIFEERCFPIAFGAIADQWSKAVRTERDLLAPARAACVKKIADVASLSVDVKITHMTDYELFVKCNRDPDLLSDTSLLDSISVVLKDEGASIADCYRILGDIHQNFPIRIGALRDFVSQPLPNGYRALHTTVFLDHNHQVRARIQTITMRDYATIRSFSSWVNDKKNDLYSALRVLHKRYYEPEEYLHELKEGVLKDRISVFTPAGDILSLPQGATGIDLAFAISPDFLPRVIALRIEGMEYEATHVLSDGDTVELILQEGPADQGEKNILWHRHAKTSEARAALQKKASLLPEDTLVRQGRMMLENECRKHLLPVNVLLGVSHLYQRVAMACGRETIHKLLKDLGAGFLPIEEVVSAYQNLIFSPPTFFIRLLCWFGILPNVRRLQKEESVVQLELHAVDRPGMVHDITRVIADRGMNLTKLTAYSTASGEGIHHLWVKVDSFEDFSNLYDAFLDLPDVKSVWRVK